MHDGQSEGRNHGGTLERELGLSHRDSLLSTASMATVEPPLYAIHSIAHPKWTATQEKGLNRDYPFTDLHLETPEQYVQRTYLQFLWLPEVRVSYELLVSWRVEKEF